MALTVAVLGGTGNLGRLFVQQALEDGHTLRVLVRNPARLAPSDHERVEAVVGDATLAEDVARVVAGADVVVSCLGNAGKLRVMDVAASHILAAAGSQPKAPRCLFISSVGCGGTSFLVKWMLIVIGTFQGLGKGSFDDYEAADTRIRAETGVPCVLVRPYALTDKAGTGAYLATENQKATFMRSISRTDVARFLLAAVTDTQWDGKPGVQLGGARWVPGEPFASGAACDGVSRVAGQIVLRYGTSCGSTPKHILARSYGPDFSSRWVCLPRPLRLDVGCHARGSPTSSPARGASAQTPPCASARSFGWSPSSGWHCRLTGT